MIKRILMQMRGASDAGPAGAPQMQAPMPQAPGLDQAYVQAPQASAQQNQMPMPMQFDPQLEAQAQAGNNQLEPIVQQIMKHMGMMGMMRNRSNQQMLDPSQG